MRSSSASIELLLHFARLPSDLASDQFKLDQIGKTDAPFCEMTTRPLTRFRSAVNAIFLSFRFTHDVSVREEHAIDCTFKTGLKKST